MEEIKKDIEKLEKEKQELIQKVQILDQNKNDIMLRIAETQGAIKFLQTKLKEKEGT